MKFLLDNWMLVAAALVSGGALLWPLLRRPVPEVTAQGAVQLINRDNALLLDVREQHEFAAGHLRGARHLPLAQVEARAGEFTAHTAQPVIVYCEVGARGATAARQLRKAGFTQVMNLKGGLGAWRDAHLPLEK